jgi:hypothetical protein
MATLLFLLAAACDGAAGGDGWLDPTQGCARLTELVGVWTGSFASDEFSDGGGSLRLTIAAVDPATCTAPGTLVLTLNAGGGVASTTTTTMRLAGDRVEYGTVAG